MGTCINVNITKKEALNNLKLKISKKYNNIFINTYKTNPKLNTFLSIKDYNLFNINTKVLYNPFKTNIIFNNNSIKARIGIVCTVSQSKYFSINPKTIWLLPENNFSADIVVYSNVLWKIE